MGFVMDFQTVFNLVVLVGLPALGWAMRTIYEDLRRLSDTVHEHKLEVAREYATNSDLGKIDAKLDRILEKMEHKVDRVHIGSSHHNA